MELDLLIRGMLKRIDSDACNDRQKLWQIQYTYRIPTSKTKTPNGLGHSGSVKPSALVASLVTQLEWYTLMMRDLVWDPILLIHTMGIFGRIREDRYSSSLILYHPTFKQPAEDVQLMIDASILAMNFSLVPEEGPPSKYVNPWIFSQPGSSQT